MHAHRHIADIICNSGVESIEIRSILACRSKHGVCKKCYGANTVLMVCGDTEVACNRPKVDHCMAEMDCAIATTQMMLAAKSLGVGSCWICAFDVPAMHAVFDLPDNLTPYILLALGYPSDTAEPAPRHFERYPLEHTVKYL